MIFTFRIEWRSQSSHVRAYLSCEQHRGTQLGLLIVETLVRTLEGALKDLVKCPQVSSADSQFFRQPSISRVQELMGFAQDSQSTASSSQKADCRPTTLSIDVRLTILWFLESLFGDVAFHVCSVHPQSTAPPKEAASNEGSYQRETCLIFEADSFLDAKMELGCREFFRQCFDTDVSFCLCCWSGLCSPILTLLVPACVSEALPVVPAASTPALCDSPRH